MIKGFKALSGTKKVLWGLGVLLTPLFIINAVSPTPEMQKAAQVNRATSASVIAPEAAETATPAPAAPKPQTKLISETVIIPYQSVTRDDPSLEAGKVVIAAAGMNGEKIVTYSVTYVGDTESGRTQVNETITKLPVNELKKIGTRPKILPSATAKPLPTSNACDNDHANVCPPATATSNNNGCKKEDSKGGTTFVRSTIQVLGLDVHKLGQDGSDIACE